MVWIFRILMVAVVFAIVVIAAVFLISSIRLNRTYDIPQQALALTIPSDAASIERGRHFAFAITGCASCHGKDLGGRIFVDAPPFRIAAPNLTRGLGGVGTVFSDGDYIRAIRHGVDPDGRALLGMPALVFTHLSDADLADIIAYVKSVPPVDRQLPAKEVRPLGRLLLATGKLGPPQAARIDHGARQPAEMEPAVSVEYGRYLATVGGCMECHGAALNGGAIPGSPPNAPPAQNITPAGIGKWSDADFFRALRVGKRPDGSTLRPPMPWPVYTNMTDGEIKALLLYLRSVPPKS